MKKKISFDYDKETGLTIATLKTKKGTFFGTSNKHPDDDLAPSYSVGLNLAEARANISLINKQIAEKRIETKTLERLLHSMPQDIKGRNYVINLLNAIHREIYHLKEQKEEWQNLIFNTIEARKLYIKSRKTNKEEREVRLKKLGDAIGALGKFNNQDKNN